MTHVYPTKLQLDKANSLDTEASFSAVVNLLFYVLPNVCGVLCWSLFWYALLYVHSNFDEEEKAGCFAFIFFRMSCYSI